MQFKKAVLANVLLAQITSGVASSALAQQPAQTASPRPVQRRGAPVRTMHQVINQMPASMPVPSPPDAKFVTGYQSQYSGEKSMTYVRLTSNNPPKELADWYKRNLQSYGWTVKERPSARSSNPASLTSTKGKANCLINFSAPTSADQKATTVMITFNEGR